MPRTAPAESKGQRSPRRSYRRTANSNRGAEMTLQTAVPNWQAGDTIPLGRKTLQVVGVRVDDPESAPVLVVRDE